MSEWFALEVQMLETVRCRMLSASVELSTRGRLPVTGMSTVSGIGGDIELFLSGLEYTRRELADAARAGSMSLSALLVCSGDIDAVLAGPQVNAAQINAAQLTLER